MEDIIVYKLFVRFLKDHNVYSAYIKNFEKHKSTRLDWANVKYPYNFNAYVTGGLNDFCEKIVFKEKIIILSFKWAETEEGKDFWEDMNAQWQKFYDDYLLL